MLLSVCSMFPRYVPMTFISFPLILLHVPIIFSHFSMPFLFTSNAFVSPLFFRSVRRKHPICYVLCPNRSTHPHGSFNNKNSGPILKKSQPHSKDVCLQGWHIEILCSICRYTGAAPACSHNICLQCIFCFHFFRSSGFATTCATNQPDSHQNHHQDHQTQQKQSETQNTKHKLRSKFNTR